MNPLLMFFAVPVLFVSQQSALDQCSRMGCRIAHLHGMWHIYLPATVDDDFLRQMPVISFEFALLTRGSCDITDAGLKEIAKMTRILSLDLGKSKITDTGLKELAPLTKLSELHITNTAVTDAG